MTPRPDPQIIALVKDLRSLARTLEDHPRLLTRSDEHAAKGYPAATVGNGSRSADGTSITERAAFTDERHEHNRRDLRLAITLTRNTLLKLHFAILAVASHADPDQDRHPRTAGSGGCGACGRHVVGTATDRLRAGWCDACRKAYERERARAVERGQPCPDRAAFERQRPADTSSKVSPLRKREHVDPKAQVNPGA